MKMYYLKIYIYWKLVFNFVILSHFYILSV